MNVRLGAAIAAAALGVLVAPPGHEQEPCGGFTLADGRVEMGSTLGLEGRLDAAAKACLQAVGAALAARKDIVSVTVAARAPDEVRGATDALAAARAAAKQLVEAGVPARRVSSVAPRAQASEGAGLFITFVSRARVRTVARVAQAWGDVTSGPDAGRLTRAIAGTRVPDMGFVRTGPGAVAVLTLEDRSAIRLAPDSLVRLGPIAFEADGMRKVTLELLAGSTETVATPGAAGSTFDIRTRTAIAGVRGTRFRVNAAQDFTTRLETLEGRVGLGAQGDTVDVPAGKGSLARSGEGPQPPRDLLAAPRVLSHQHGAATRGETLRWEGPREAASYLVELARDADFTEGFASLEAAGPALALAEVTGDGKWFWRVKAVDADGFVGFGSKIFAFSLSP